MHLQGENSINYTVISDFVNTKKNICNVDKYLCTEESIELSQSTSDDTVRVSVRQSDSAHNRIASEILFLFQQSRIENPDDIKNVLGL